ncbi:UDP-glucose 4-epimerase GalE [Labilibaculum sp. A4]|uniref:UDP-glucose 4-epimerase GalE n=1 Tax=Labilibaculum euxinus TaxID=2686357 RepID=UPI000F626A67|nr:UDP-glucose 4-epimerase GalE [Labilibaculum euxinus]MDQ1771241.1 UDP-glucose 4-epimerase GalE [Labilibaculum euxinus]MWN77028.1 UDP-glucose 4-epimerase GalE [Labilibaculum euxinus]
MNKQILVTGGTGFIGSHTVVELQNSGYDVVIVDNLSNSKVEVLNKIKEISGIRPKFEQFDLTDRQKVKDFFHKYSDIEAIIHFAASKAVGESVEKPLMYYNNNLNSLMNIMESMMEFNVSNLVFSSSCTVYGQPDCLPVTEQTPRKEAESPYGNTKTICEDIIRDTIKACPSLKGIALRYFNPIGAHATAKIGELPLGVPNNLIPFLTQTVAGIRPELSVFGDDYDTADGSAIRDYIHVVDLAKAHVVAIERLLNNRNKENYEYFNVGTGNGVSVLEIIKSFERATGEKVPHKIVARRAGDIEKIYADTSFANEELGWKAESTLDETLLSAWKWQLNI